MRVVNDLVGMRATSEDGGSRDDQLQPVTALGQLDAERSKEGPVKTESEAVVVLQSLEVEIGPARGHLTGIVENRRVEIAAGHDTPLPLEEQAVPIAKPQARITPQRRTAAQAGQH